MSNYVKVLITQMDFFINICHDQANLRLVQSYKIDSTIELDFFDGFENSIKKTSTYHNRLLLCSL